jgi:3-hydroxyisobutyrate dehydrogenase-like beta-hydroxyacid dehydrogenase
MSWRASEIVCTNVTASADVEGLADALRPGLAPGAIHVDFSTIAPGAARAIAARTPERGVEFVDAPVSGGGVGARNATLAIMWGGARNWRHAWRRCFRCWARARCASARPAPARWPRPATR